MVYTVTLNPALDCYVSPEALVPGRDLRYGGCRFVPGGKGINVSLLLASLGLETMALGVAGGFTGRELAARLEGQGLATGFVFLEDGLTRVNIKITPPGQPETALNGGGPEIPPQALDQLEKRLAALAAEDFLVLAGSVPASLPAGAYARLAQRVPAGVKVVVDASGPALAASAAARPFLMKPNREELAEAFGEPASTREEMVGLAKKLQSLGARNVAVTLGGEGALLVDESGELLIAYYEDDQTALEQREPELVWQYSEKFYDKCYIHKLETVRIQNQNLLEVTLEMKHRGGDMTYSMTRIFACYNLEAGEIA